MSLSPQQTALGTARERFLESLPRKAGELRGAVVALAAQAPQGQTSVTDLRRRLHALYASAQVFRLRELADALRDAIARLDAAHEAHRALSPQDLEAISGLAVSLPAFGRGKAKVPSADASSVPPPRRAPRASRIPTLAGTPAPDVGRGPDPVVAAVVVEHGTGDPQAGPLREALARPGIEVFSATTPGRALELIQAVGPELVIADVAALGDGPEAFRAQLGADPMGRDAALLILDAQVFDPRTLHRALHRVSQRSGAPAAAYLGPAVYEDLSGQRILLAVEHDAVRGFLSTQLTEAGAVVAEVTSLAEIVPASVEQYPDAVVYGLTGAGDEGARVEAAFRSHAALVHTPLVQLFGAEALASGLRTHPATSPGMRAVGQRVLSEVRSATRSRRLLRQRLDGPGELRGRIDKLGPIELLLQVSKVRPDTRVTVRDGWSFFELELRHGDLVDMTMTAADGSFTRGNDAVLSLLGLTEGRFVVAPSTGTRRPTIQGSLDETLGRGFHLLTDRLETICEAATSPELRFSFHDEIVKPLLPQMTPDQARAVAELSRGTAPRKLVPSVLSGEEVEGLLLGLARRGAIAAIRDRDGSNRWAQDLKEDAAPTLPTGFLTRQRISRPNELDAPFVDRPAAASSAPRPAAPVAAPVPSEASEPAPVVAREPTQPIRVPGPAAADELDREEPVEAEVVEPASTVRPEGVAPARRTTERSTNWFVLLAILSVVGFLGWHAFSDLVFPDPPEADVNGLPKVEDRPQSRTVVPRASQSAVATAPTAADPTVRASSPTVVDPDPYASIPAEDEARSWREELSFGRSESGIAQGSDVPSVAPDQGLLKVEPAADQGPVQVSSGDRDLGEPPLMVALPEGRHELVFRRGEEISFRYIYLRRGHTRTVRAPAF